MSLNDLKCIRSLTDKPLDVHLMVEHPINTVDIFIRELRKGDTIYIHPEAEYHPSATLMKVINAGLIPGIAINPGTSVETIYEMMRIVDKVLVMSVNPGNAAQMFLPFVGEKYEKLLPYRSEMNFEVYWDGACTADKVEKYSRKGVKGFVLGTNLLFGKGKAYSELLPEIRKLLPGD
jgi:ribulose-phosphate 3-epimerase